ncbi:hypothetical protein REJC140_00420 [Pseudorhizobium endolithicum]|uniref:Lipoprotein n=1 Tax=Pseudorhizobium endolithicum TaxID=1191678 RepID=A0ABM8PE44_9HYPH|nr:hypothetical protein [Pseudorhizobium endolithicum]CAD7024067.1 hypothetical protein REJC140_00420 [Pseudorhizobium endolithicum]
MRISGTAALLAVSAALLSACNTTDALTPPADVGGGLRASSPVTQDEADRLARSAEPQTYPVYPQQQADRQRAPQNTLEAQAQALQSGNAPASPSPASQAAQAPPSLSTASPSQPSSSGEAAAQGTIRFLPIIGAPVQAVTPLSRRLGSQARVSGLSIRASGDNSTDHILKGYFSAFSDGDAVTVVYVWDILDNTGSRLHRLQGQERLPGARGDPWASVPAATMETIATKTINEYVAWKNARAG